jgi:hypothetical protein
MSNVSREETTVAHIEREIEIAERFHDWLDDMRFILADQDEDGEDSPACGVKIVKPFELLLPGGSKLGLGEFVPAYQ